MGKCALAAGKDVRLTRTESKIRSIGDRREWDDEQKKESPFR